MIFRLNSRNYLSVTILSADDEWEGAIFRVLSAMRNVNRNRAAATMSGVLLGIAFLLSAPSKAFGYADPGTGAFLYQAAYAAFIGGAFYFRKLLNRIFRKRQ